MTVNRLTMTQKLVRLKQLITDLERIGKMSEKDFVTDAIIQAATERYFTLGIEIITDIGNHLLVELVSVPGTSYENIIEELGRKGIVPKQVAVRNRGMAKFRNLLIHVYDVVDPQQVYLYLKKAPKEFTAFAKAFAKYL